MLKVYRSGSFWIVEFGPTNIVSYSLAGTYHIAAVANGYLHMYVMVQQNGIVFPRQIFGPKHYSDILDENGVPAGANLADVITYLTAQMGPQVGTLYIYTASNYTDLVATAPAPNLYDLAYVRNAQGTQWLPGTIGGTYYPNGTYLWNGSAWVSDRNAVATSFSELYAADTALQLQINSKADLADPRFPTTQEKAALVGTNGSPSAANHYLTDTDPRNTNARTPTAHTHAISEVIGLTAALAAKSDVGHTHIPSQVGLGNVPNVDATNPANIVQTPTYRFVSDVEHSTWNGKQNAIGYTPENVANLGITYAPVVAGKIPSTYIPGSYDDVLEGTWISTTVFNDPLGAPYVPAKGILYSDTTTNKIYRWGGSVYVELSPSPGSTDAVPEGVVNLYFTSARVLATILTGLSLVSSVAITAADTILTALGKLQAQITAHVPFLPTANQKAAMVSPNPATVSNYFITLADLVAALAQSGAAATRPVVSNTTGAGWTVSATKYSRVDYNLQIVVSISLSGGQVGDMYLEIAPAGTLPGGVWSPAANYGMAKSGSLVIGLALTDTVRNTLGALVPPNYLVRIRFVGTGTGSYISGRETFLG